MSIEPKELRSVTKTARIRPSIFHEIEKIKPNNYTFSDCIEDGLRLFIKAHKTK